MNLRRPRNYEDDFVGASIEFINVAIEAPAVLRSGVADRFLELALHDVAVEPAAYFLPEKNPRVLGGSSFSLRWCDRERGVCSLALPVLRESHFWGAA